MRWICSLVAVLFSAMVYAAPADSADGLVAAPASPGLLNHINDVGSRIGEVSEKIGEVGSKIGAVGSAVGSAVGNTVGSTLGDVGSHIGEVGSRLGAVGSQVQARASELVNGALGLLGVPYRRGGTSADTGFDCSGFVRSVYQQTAGLLLPRSAAQQAAATERINKADLKPGDLVFFNTMRRAFSHVGIYVGNGKFIHAPKPGAEVRVEDLGVAYWAKRFDGARRVPEGDDQSPPPVASAPGVTQ